MIAALHPDAGEGVGLGHVSRCCALALALRRQGFRPVVLNGAGEALDTVLRRQGLDSVACADADAGTVAATARRLGAGLLVADSYRLDRVALAAAVGGLKLAWFDDTATAPPLADVLINGSPAAAALPYALPPQVLGLLGPAYQVVRPGLTFHPRAGPVRRLLITYGGADPWRVGPVLAGLCAGAATVDFVVGPFAAVPANLPADFALHHAPPDMPALLGPADLAVSAGGQTLYELAACGVPTLAIGLGPDQRPTLETLAAAGALLFAGWAGDPGLLVSLQALLDRALAAEDLRRGLSERAHALIDGRGADRIAVALRRLVD